MNTHLWQGEIISADQFKKLFLEKKEDIFLWKKKPLGHENLFYAIEKVSEELTKKGKLYHELKNDLKSRGDINEAEVDFSLENLIAFLNINQLQQKLKRELGSEHPFELKRQTGKESYFEAWWPLGTLVHITPNNSPLLAILASLEGLLSGNVNILKLARKEKQFSALFYQALCRLDFSNTIKNYIYIAQVNSQEKDFLKELLDLADIISVWGGEESVASIKEIAPKEARIVEWGHKISFAYVTRSQIEEEKNYDKLALEICLNEQLSCSSPQVIFVENSHFLELKLVGAKLAFALKKISPQIKRVLPGENEISEITILNEQVRLNSLIEESCLIVADENDWRIYIENSPYLSSSPLYRSIWLKPMPRIKLVENLRPLKKYLQTAGILASETETESLVRDLFMAGVQRVCHVGEMTESYVGEAHDGVYALERFCQRINFRDSKNNPLMQNKFSFENEKCTPFLKGTPIMEKDDFINHHVEKEFSDLFFYSGGSSGKPKLSVFTYEDYHRQMAQAAEGLYAAGLNPNEDRCMNLFYAGGLYGGFISFFTILEKLNATHFPMGANTDYGFVGKTIVENNVDTLLGMPSYILQVFKENYELLKEYKKIKKIFYGGEHFSESSQKYLKENFGVKFIRSASYGSVDAGPLGFQCPFCEGGIHHLQEKLHDLEIVNLESDHPVKKGEIGRLLFTSKVRHGQKIQRYAIGDVGRELTGPCLCGRAGVRFELLGRHGDIFRIGTTFLSYQKFQKILFDKFESLDSFQLHLYSGEKGEKETVEVKIEKNKSQEVSLEKSPDEIRETILGEYPDLNLVVNLDRVLNFKILFINNSEIIYNKSTGKKKTVIDHRK